MIPNKKELFLFLIGLNFSLLGFSLFLSSIQMAIINILSIISFYISYKMEKENE